MISDRPVFVRPLQRLLHSRQQGDQAGIAHVLNLHHPLLVGDAVHMTPEVLLKTERKQTGGACVSMCQCLCLCGRVHSTYLLAVAGDAAQIAVELVGALCYTFLPLLVVR